MPVKSWFDDVTDSELLDLIPLFEKLSKVDSVYSVLCNSNHPLKAQQQQQQQQTQNQQQQQNPQQKSQIINHHQIENPGILNHVENT